MSRSSLSRLDAMGAFQRGLYSQQLRRVFAAFPRDRVLILQYERCRADPAAEIARTFDFLGLAPFGLPPDALARPVNPTKGARLELSADLRAALAVAYAPDLAELAALAPEIELERWPAWMATRG
ncbi:MAG: sulfotransferase domain-containing protein, partial [Candidatus Limnocylindrales bacterium]